MNESRPPSELLDHTVRSAARGMLSPPKVRYLNQLYEVLERHAPAHIEAILEWGTGHSTSYLYDLAEMRGARLFATIDHEADYQAEMLRAFPPASFFEAHVVDLIGARLRQGRDDSYNYATYPFQYGHAFSLIYIDGRRRNECLLVASELLDADGVAILHDATRRRYEVGMRLFEQVAFYERAGGIAVLRRK